MKTLPPGYEWTEGQPPKGKGGVYLWAETDSILYVGSSSDLRARWRQHKSNPWFMLFTEEHTVTFWWVLVPKWKEVEAQLVPLGDVNHKPKKAPKPKERWKPWNAVRIISLDGNFLD